MIRKRHFNSTSPCIMIKIKVCIEKEDAEKETRDRDFNIVADFGRREFTHRTNGANGLSVLICVVICVPKESSTCVRRNIQRITDVR